MKQSQNKAELFNINIRRNARTKIFETLRMRFNYNCSEIDQIAKKFQLPPKQSPYTIYEILHKCSQILLHPKEWLQLLDGKMEQEANQSDMNEAKIICEKQTDFWAYLVKQLYEQKLKPSEELYNFLEEFIKINQYRIIAADTLYQTKVINTLQLVTYSSLTTKHFKRCVLKWVTGTQGIVLLCNAMISEFLDPQEYSNFYAVLSLGFQLIDFTKLTACCELIIYCFRNADTDQLYDFYERHSQLMVQIINKASLYSQANDITIFGDAILTLCNSYNTVVLDYTRMGIALLATRMAKSSIQANIIKGLQILTFCSEVQKKQMIQFLTQDEQLKNQGFWQDLYKSPKFLKNPNINIRKHAFSILANVMAQGQCQDTLNIANMFEINEGENIMQFLKVSLEQEEDIETLNYILAMISTLVYYGNILKEQYGENIPLKSFMKLGLQQILQKYTKHLNEKISTCSIELMEAISYEENNYYQK